MLLVEKVEALSLDEGYYDCYQYGCYGNDED